MSEGRFEIHPLGPYSLAASVRFLEGFTPAAYEGSEAGHLHLAFVADGFAGGDERVAGVCIRSEGDGIMGEVFGEAQTGVVERQVARILSLDVDGRGFSEVGKRDRVVGGLQARYAGLRPVCFNSPYEAAAWAIIGHGVRIVQAAKLKARMAKELGTPVEIHGRREHAFPGPSRLMGLERFQGLTGRKVEYLRGLAEEASAGRLDATRLRSLSVGEALGSLKGIPGIGDFSAELILLRGAGEPDYLPAHEPRLARAVALAYGLVRSPTAGDLEKMAERWRPYRTWVSLHLRQMLEEETREIAGVGGRSST